MATKTVETKIDKLVPDNINANKGTEYGQHLVEKSLREFGAGRSILIDKNNRIIAGNKTVENAAAIGLEKVIIVETTGDQIVAVKRTDIDLDSREGRELALADNATSKANLAWDEKAVQQIQSEWEIAPEDWGINMQELADLNSEEPQNSEEPYTNKIKAPVYEPKGEKPEMSEMLDETKADELTKAIMASNVDGETKRFLCMAAKRHLVFNYEKIAEFYAHASKEVQELMEDSALVIIDFNKAIENGYVKLSQEIADQYKEENGDEE